MNAFNFLNHLKAILCCVSFLASQDALEVMLLLTDSLSYLLMVRNDFTDVTLVGDDT